MVVNLANDQVADNEVYVVSSPEGGAWKALDPKVQILNIDQMQRAVSVKDGAVLLKLAAYRVVLQPDIVHLHSSKIGALGRLAFSRNNTVYTVHGFDSIRVAHRKYLFIEKLLKNRCASIVAVSKYDEDNLRNEGISENLHCIFNGVADCRTKGEKNDEETWAMRLKGLASGNRKILMTIARDDPPKRLDLFLEAARRMPDHEFVWIGNTKEHAGGDNVHWMGCIPKAYRCLEYADLFLLLSDYEGMPVSIIEALSLGKPVVASNVGGNKEIIDGSNGRLVLNDVIDIEKRIHEVLSDPVEYGKMSLAARESYEKKFTVQTMADSYQRLYAKMAGSH